jgi:uncharacterized membrane protein
VKALSPSLNDPTAATACGGYLEAIFERLASTPALARVRRFRDPDVTLSFAATRSGTNGRSSIGRFPLLTRLDR